MKIWNGPFYLFLILTSVELFFWNIFQFMSLHVSTITCLFVDTFIVIVCKQLLLTLLVVKLVVVLEEGLTVMLQVFFHNPTPQTKHTFSRIIQCV